MVDKAKLAQALQLQGRATEPTVMERVGDFASGANATVQQAVTLGLADEAAALGATAPKAFNFLAGLITGDGPTLDELEAEFDLNLAAARAPSDSFARDNPRTSDAVNIVGGLAATPASLGKQAITRTGRIMRGVATGGAFGLVAGAGRSEGGPENRVVGGIQGGLTGAAAGGFFSVLAEGVTNLFTKSLTRPERTALNSVVRAFKNDGVEMKDAMVRLRQWRNMGAKPEILADLGGDNVKRLLGAAITVPGKTTAAGTRALTSRARGQADRIFDDAVKALGVKGDFGELVKRLKVGREAASDPLYEAARSELVQLRGENFTVDDLSKILSRPTMLKALKLAQKLAKDEGRALPQTIKVVDGEVKIDDLPDVDTLDRIKKLGLDAVIEKFRDKTTGKINASDPRVRSILQLKSDYMAIVDDLAPKYANARQAYAGPTESLNALQEGRDLFKTVFQNEPAIINEKLKAMTTGEKEFFRVGVAQAIRDKIETAPDSADIIKRIFGTRRFRQLLRIAMPNEGEFLKFQVAMDREVNLLRTNQLAGLESGSRTTPLAEAVADMVSDAGIEPGDALRAVSGDPTGIASKLFKKLGKAGFEKKLKADVADAIGKILLTGDPDKIGSMIVKLRAVTTSAGRSTVLQDAVTRDLGADSGREQSVR